MESWNHGIMESWTPGRLPGRLPGLLKLQWGLQGLPGLPEAPGLKNITKHKHKSMENNLENNIKTKTPQKLTNMEPKLNNKL